MSESTLQILAIAIGGGGLVGSLAALFKLRPDNARTTVSAAEGAVIVQSGVIKSLQEENDRLREHCDELMRQLDAINERRITEERSSETERRRT